MKDNFFEEGAAGRLSFFFYRASVRKKMFIKRVTDGVEEDGVLDEIDISCHIFCLGTEDQAK